MTNIVLIGLPGSGKTTVGRVLASQLDYSYFDTDEFIEMRCIKPLSDIIDELGEPYFRDMEKTIIHELRAEKESVISTGGGAVLDADNQKALNQIGTVIYLSVSHEEQVSRLAGCRTRPFLRSGDVSKTLLSMREKRLSTYHQLANITVETSKKSPERIAGEIIASLSLACS